MHDFFISYSSQDRGWAEWIAWQLEESGFTVIVQSWDFRPGTNFVLEMHTAAKSAARTIAVLSPDFLASPFPQSEWASAFATDPSSTLSALIPVKVRECTLSGLLSAIVHIDLVGLSEDVAKRRLLAGVALTRSKPQIPPSFPLAVQAGPELSAQRQVARPARFLHLSGTHFRSADTDPVKRSALDALPSVFASSTGADQLAGLILSGDLTQAGSQAEFSRTHAAISELCARLGLPPAQGCFLTPGNHDVSWSSIGPADTSVLAGLVGQEQIAKVLAHPPTMFMLSTRLKNFYEFTEELLGKARAWRPERPWKVETRLLSGLRVAFIQLNSAWTLGPTSPDPMIGEFQVREAVSEAGDADFRIWVVHHPLESLRHEEYERVAPLILSDKARDIVFVNACHTPHEIPPRPSNAELVLSAFSFDRQDIGPTCNVVCLDTARRLFEVQTLWFDRHSLRWLQHATGQESGRLSKSPAPKPAQSPARTADQRTHTTKHRHGLQHAKSEASPALTTRSFQTEPNIRSVPRAEVDQALQPRRPVLLLTAVETELRTVLALLRPLHPRRLVMRTHIGQETYYVGTFGTEPAVVTMCGMGAMGRDSVLLAAQQAISELKPVAIIMIGIAFGKSSAMQRIGDVLIASQVVSYEQQRVRADNVVHRGTISLSGPILLNRFRQALDWTFASEKGDQVRALVGPVLSGEKLIDSEQFRDHLFEAFPQAIGGEMEGAGLAAVAAHAQTEWILVKGICDWADGRKTDNHQAFAAQCAASLVHHVLSDPSALEAARA